MKPYLIILYYIAMIAILASADALNDSNAVEFGHNIEPLGWALLGSGAFMFKFVRKQWLVFIIVLALLNIALFDPLYNWVAGYDLFHVGTAPTWDKIIAKIPPIGMAFIRLWALALGVGLIFRYLKE